MSIEFDRRSFLKAGAAAAALGAMSIVLTGCDSDSKDGAPAINTKVVDGKAYKLGSISITPESDGGFCAGMYEFYFTVANSTSKDITLYSDSFAAYYKGNALYLHDIDDKAVSPITISAAGEEDLIAHFSSITADAIPNCVFKFHFGDKSIKFQQKNNILYTSGVYTDKIAL